MAALGRGVRVAMGDAYGLEVKPNHSSNLGLGLIRVRVSVRVEVGVTLD